MLPLLTVALTFGQSSTPPLTGRPGLDRTGLKGNFDFKLEWTPDAAQSAATDGGPLDPGGPSLFTAIQEQLGLQLESQKGLVETIVIDRVERPAEVSRVNRLAVPSFSRLRLRSAVITEPRP
jgi:uncharacterized protein (TIGR03435 family)